MFLSNSRYAKQPTVTTTAPDGSQIQALTLRHLPATTGVPREVKDNDQLDLLALRQFGDGTKGWAIADANTALDARDLTATTGDLINIPS